MMHIILDLSPEAAECARDEIAKDRGLWLFGKPQARSAATRSGFELYVGDALMELSDDEVVAAFAALLVDRE